MIKWGEMGRDGAEWGGMGWDGVGWAGMGWEEVGWDAETLQQEKLGWGEEAICRAQDIRRNRTRYEL